MRLTQKLLGFLNKPFDKSPDSFLALRISHVGGAMTWRVRDAMLTTVLPDNSVGVGLSVDLTQYTVASLVNFIAAQPGYLIEYGDQSELSLLGARVLIDGAGDIATSNGDHLYGYQNFLWAFMESSANELALAEVQIKQMLLQMSTTTAEGEWLDEIGGYYGIPRLPAELDDAYGPRIITETLRPRGNNVAMEIAIRDFTGQVAKVTDVTLYTSGTPLYNNTILYDGTFTHSAGSNPVYGLFDVEYGYDLINGGTIGAFAQQVRDLIERLRDAGTHLRALSLTGSALVDTFTNPPTDGPDTLSLAAAVPLADAFVAPSENTSIALGMAPLADVSAAPSEDASISITYSTLYDGLIRYDGKRTHASGTTAPEALP